MRERDGLPLRTKGEIPSRRTGAGLVYWGNCLNDFKGEHNEQTI